MIARLVIAALVATAFAAAPAHAARADLMVVGKQRVLRGAGPVTIGTATVRVGGRRCRVGPRTPLAVLAKTALRLRLRDYGGCSRRPADATGLYVRGIGSERERGRDGWVYKLGNRAPTTGAGDLASRVRRGARVLWFWCRNGARGCQRTLAVRPARRSAAPGQALDVTVTAYDDEGRGRPAAGATVRLGPATATTGASGTATLAVPGGARARSLVATRAALVRSFPVRIATR